MLLSIYSSDPGPRTSRHVSELRSAMGGSESRPFGTVTVAGGVIIYLTRVSEEHIGKTWEAELSTSKTMEKVKFTFSIPERFSLTRFLL